MRHGEKLNHASRFQAKHFGKAMWKQSKPNTQTVYSSDGEKRVRKSWRAWSIVRNWHFADTKLIKSLTRFTRIGFERRLFNCKHSTIFYANANLNLKISRKKMKKTWNGNFVNNTLFKSLIFFIDTISTFKIVPDNAVSTESMSTRCLHYGLSKLHTASSAFVVV